MHKCKYSVNTDSNMAYENILNFLNQVSNLAGRALIYIFPFWFRLFEEERSA